VPEGDTIHRTASALRIALVGKITEGFEAPMLVGPAPQLGRRIERIESHGKHLEMAWDDGLVLHTHMRMTGSWHLYRIDERWRRPTRQMRAAISTADWVAVCFNAPVVETYREFDRRRHPGFGRLGPDLCQPAPDIDECVRRLATYENPRTPIAEVLLDQRVACGVGNVYRSEILWACGVHPLAAVGDLTRDQRYDLIETAHRQLRANLEHSSRITAPTIPGGLAAYGRNGQPCARCGDVVQVRRIGDHARLVYWCDGCQTAHAPRRERPRAMDPHPAAAKFLDDLPWRRDVG
jgi:endonuclease-8